jgi:hypothetical protein
MRVALTVLHQFITALMGVKFRQLLRKCNGWSEV